MKKFFVLCFVLTILSGMAATADDKVYQKKMKGTDFSGQNLSGKNFAHAELDESNFAGANLTGANFTNADIEKCDFRGANLTNTNFSYADLEESNLKGAVLKNTNFKHAELEYAIWTNGKVCAEGSIGGCW